MLKIAGATPFDSISSITFFKDNQNAIVVTNNHDIKKLNWKKNASSEKDFSFIKSYEFSLNIYNNELPFNPRKSSFRVFLTDDEKNVLIGSEQSFMVLNLNTCEVTN